MKLDLSRDEIESRTLRHLAGGDHWRPHILLLRGPAGPLVVKDYAERGFFLRHVLGPFLIAREVRAYRRLDGLSGVPRFLGRLDRHALVIEYVNGRPPRRSDRGRIDASFFSAVDAVVQAIHDRGIVHCDLRHRSNFLITEDDRPYVIDYASAMRFGRGRFSRRVLVPLLAWVDRGGILKMRAKILGKLARNGDRRWDRIPRILARLWLPDALRRRKHGSRGDFSRVGY